MNYQNLEDGEMLNGTNLLFDENSDVSQAMTELPELKAFLPHVKKPHDDLAATQNTLGKVEKQNLNVLGKDLDLSHDDLARLMYKTLYVMLLFAKDEETLDRIRKIIEKFFPDKLNIVKKSYRDEAGEAVRREKYITQEERNFLQSLTILHTNLLEIFDEWNAVSHKLGEVEDRKLELVKDRAKYTPAYVRDTRHQWIKAVKTLIVIAGMIEELPQPVTDWIDRLNEMEHKASIRKKRLAYKKSSSTEPQQSDSVDTDQLKKSGSVDTEPEE